MRLGVLDALFLIGLVKAANGDTKVRAAAKTTAFINFPPFVRFLKITRVVSKHKPEAPLFRGVPNPILFI